PIDVKKNKGSMSSLDKYKEHNKCDVAVKVSQNKYGYDNQQNLLTLPFYYFCFYLNDLYDKSQSLVERSKTYEQ
ncbi:MAG: hypothetical protein PHY11_02375, partial [Bacilli bacterium]|nr:hypothetical protein [Bacilli bacterium]